MDDRKDPRQAAAHDEGLRRIEERVGELPRDARRESAKRFDYLLVHVLPCEERDQERGEVGVGLVVQVCAYALWVLGEQVLRSGAQRRGRLAGVRSARQ